MSEFGTIPEPYRGLPSQGNLVEEIMRFAQGQQQMQALRDAQLTRGATMQTINDHIGMQGIDPFALQGFNQGQQQMNIAGAQEGRANTLHQQEQDFARNYVPRAQDLLSASPFLRSLQGIAPSPVVAKLITGGLGARDQHSAEVAAKQQMLQQELASRRQMNQDEMTSRAQSAKDVAGIQTKAELDKIREIDRINQEKEGRYSKFVAAAIKGEISIPDAARALGYGGNDALVFAEQIQQAQTAAKKKAQEEANRGLIADGQAGPTTLPLTQDAADRQAQQTKDTEWNRAKELYNFLPDDEKAMVYDRQGKVTAEGAKLLETIKQQLLYDRLVEKKGPNPGIPLQEWKKVIPHIIKQVEQENPYSPW